MHSNNCFWAICRGQSLVLNHWSIDTRCRRVVCKLNALAYTLCLPFCSLLQSWEVVLTQIPLASWGQTHTIVCPIRLSPIQLMQNDHRGGAVTTWQTNEDRALHDIQWLSHWLRQADPHAGSLNVQHKCVQTGCWKQSRNTSWMQAWNKWCFSCHHECCHLPAIRLELGL